MKPYRRCFLRRFNGADFADYVLMAGDERDIVTTAQIEAKEYFVRWTTDENTSEEAIEAWLFWEEFNHLQLQRGSRFILQEGLDRMRRKEGEVNWDKEGF